MLMVTLTFTNIIIFLDFLMEIFAKVLKHVDSSLESPCFHLNGKEGHKMLCYFKWVVNIQMTNTA